MKLLIQPRDGITPLLGAIKRAKKSIDILVFRFDLKKLESALKAASNRGIALRALIANTNRGGETKLRTLETRFLDAGITVARTADDLSRYHGKLMIIDCRELILLSFNFVHIDVEHSRGFGVITKSPKIVREAQRLFEADLNRQTYSAELKTLVVSPVNSRKQLTSFIKQAKKQLLIYDPKISDKQMLHLLEDHARAGVEVRIIGATTARSAGLQVTPLTSMRLHTRTIIRDGRQAFIGSQSLRPQELDSRREIGILVRDAKVVNGLRSTFEEDWKSSCFDEARNPAKLAVDANSEHIAARELIKELPPVKTTLKKAIKQAVSKAGKDLPLNGEVKTVIKDMVKSTVKEAVKEAVLDRDR